jgi:aldose 1-epimerase
MQQIVARPSGAQYEITSGDHRVVVVEVGGGLRVYDMAGQPVLDGYGEAELAPSGAGQVLAPWPNRIRDGRYTWQGQSYQLDLSEPVHFNALHGLVRWVPWRLVAASESAVTLGYDLPARPGYPWSLALSTTWSVGPDGLRAEHSATNLSAAPAPYGLGAHPYVTVPGVALDELTVTVPAASRLLLDGRKLPIGAAKVAGGDYDFSAGRRLGAARLDTAFGDLPMGGSTVTLSTVDGSRAVKVWADGSFRWWQLFTGDGLAAPRSRRALGVEPMTCPPDAFHSGRDLVTLAPGETWRGAWGITPSLG